MLTVVTQIGGLVLLILLLLFKFVSIRIHRKWLAGFVNIASFGALYLLFTFLFVPLIAPMFGRVALPVLERDNLKPANVWTCVLNRHYVKPELLEVSVDVARKLGARYPDAKLNYLDGNFPFIDKFPLLPHLSHNDGKKLDLAFQYDDQRNVLSTEVPSFIGYGVCEEPVTGEINKPVDCEKKGYWQYSILKEVVPQGNKKNFKLSPERTRFIVNTFATREEIEKIFIEPHLRARLGLASNKIRFHGCQAVRHDDHIHIQLK